MEEYIEALIDQLEDYDIAYDQEDPFDVDTRRMEEKTAGMGLFINFKVEDPETSMKTEFFKHQDLMQRLHEAAIASALKLHPHALSMFFDFPDEIRVACEQYLLYFAKFLEDLGVKADTALTHEAGQVLFTVIPTDEKVALDKIRHALEVFLHLPSSPIGESQNESIAVQRLEANIFRLRGDLKLAAAELQAKQTTIRAQELIINVHKGILSGEILVDSIRDVTPKPEDKEDLIKGVVALSTYKDKGIEINLGELLRRFKKWFGERGD